MMFRQATSSAAEERLEQLTSGSGNSPDGKIESPLLTKSLDELSSSLVGYFSRLLNLRVFLEQAGTSIEPSRFLAVVGLLAGVGAMACIVLPQLPIVLAPVLALVLAAVPFVWLRFKRKRRLKLFAKQLPEALELIARALRAGHSLASGMHLVATEMSEPIGHEFARCYDEQNLGVPLEETL